jgi:hypothetical protein
MARWFTPSLRGVPNDPQRYPGPAGIGPFTRAGSGGAGVRGGAEDAGELDG